MVNPYESPRCVGDKPPVRFLVLAFLLSWLIFGPAMLVVLHGRDSWISAVAFHVAWLLWCCTLINLAVLAYLLILAWR